MRRFFKCTWRACAKSFAINAGSPSYREFFSESALVKGILKWNYTSQSCHFEFTTIYRMSQSHLYRNQLFCCWTCVVIPSRIELNGIHERQKYFHNNTCLCCHLSEANLNLCGRTETKMNICVKVYNPRLTTKEWYSLHEVHFKSSFKWTKNISCCPHTIIYSISICGMS